MKAAAPPTQIIPGLPNDIAFLCLSKVPRIYHTCLASVCFAWRDVVSCPRFYQERRRLGSMDAWLVVISVETLSPVLLYSAYDLSTKQLLFKIKFPPSLPVDHHVSCVEAPPCGVDPTCHISALHTTAAGNSSSVSMERVPNVATQLQNLDYYRIVAMNEYFAVLGFTQQSRLRPPMCTFTIYNTLTDRWWQARPLKICREMPACGVIEGRLYVVGGYNEKGVTERRMEVYDFEAEEWGMAEALPEWVGRVQGDVVYQGKLYVQCWEEGGEGKCVVCVYSPKDGKWGQLKGRQMGGGQTLVATDKFIYAMGGQEDLGRYEGSSGEWKTVGKIKQTSSKLTAAKVRRRQTRSGNPYTSQRAFGHGDEIFVLQETNGTATCGLLCNAGTKCHRLVSVKPSWYHAGAVVEA